MLLQKKEQVSTFNKPNRPKMDTADNSIGCICVFNIIGMCSPQKNQNFVNQRIIKKTSKFGNTIYETKKKRVNKKKTKLNTIEQNLQLKLSTINNYKNYIIKAYKLGYDFDMNKYKTMTHLKNYILFENRKNNTNKKRGG